MMKRVIPVVLLQRGMVVRAQEFSRFQKIGNPIYTIERLSSWSVDELILLERSPEETRDAYLDRKDIERTFSSDGLVELLKHVSPKTFMPLTVGGGIKSIDHIRALFNAGADKICINTAAYHNPELVAEAANEFGSQSIVVSIDAKKRNGSYHVVTNCGADTQSMEVVEWARKCDSYGAGELIVNNVDIDGVASGMDHDLLNEVANNVSLPVIGLGGVGSPEDVLACFDSTGVNAVGVANYFHFKELSYPLVKKKLVEESIQTRGPRVGKSWFEREPAYDNAGKRRRLADRLVNARQRRNYDSNIIASSCVDNASPPPVQFCRKCVAPSSSAIPLGFDEHGVCSGCRGQEEAVSSGKAGPHEPSELLRAKIVDSVSNKSNYDCIIAVSGGKDSYYQTYYIKEVLGLRPLLVTYYGNNYTAEGEHNLNNMSKAFGVDHIIIKPSVATLRKLNWLGFAIMGDMNWHNHIGIATVPFQVAVEKGVPIVIYGEHGYADLGGQFSSQDFVEWTYRHRLEHFARGYDWSYMVGFRGLCAGDMSFYQYPSDYDLWSIGVRGLFLANYTSWDGNQNAEIASNYGFRAQEVASQRTYRKISNLDDMHENGVHDYLRWVKFGYGRCTDHACKDVRAGLIDRHEAARLVRDYDSQKPDDLYRWLSYVGVSESLFDKVADTFRDPRVWRETRDGWIKKSVWDEYDDL